MPGKRLEPGQEILTEEERQKILDRTRSVFSWVGNLIPEKMKFDDAEIDLRNIVFNLRTKKKFTDDDRALATLLIGKIKAKKAELENRLRHDRMTREAAIGLLNEISGLVKAINDLHDVEMSEDLEKRKSHIMNRIEDEKRWQKYLGQLKLGKMPD